MIPSQLPGATPTTRPIEMIPVVDVESYDDGIPQSTTPPSGMTATFGENPWDVDDDLLEQEKRQWRSNAFGEVDRAVTDPNAFFGDQDLGFGADVKQGRMLATNDLFLKAVNDGENVPVRGPEREAMRNHVSFQFFNGLGAKSEEEFNGQVVKRTTEINDRRNQYKELQQEAWRSAVVAEADPDKPNPFTWEAFHEKAKSMPGYKPDDVVDLRIAWNESTQELRQRVEPFRDELSQVWGAMKQGGKGTLSEILKEGIGGDLSNPTETIIRAGVEMKKEDAAATAYRIYSGLSDDEKPMFIDALGVVAQTFPKEEQEGFFNNLVKQGGRGVDDFADNAGSIPGRGDDVSTLGDIIGGVGPTGAQLRRTIQADRAEILKKKDFVDEVKRIERGDFAPVKYLSDEDSGFRIIEEGLYQAPGAFFTSAVFATPMIGQALALSSMEGASYSAIRDNLLKSGVDPERARILAGDMAPFATVPQGIMEKFQANAIVGKMPFFDAAMKRIGDQVSNLAVRGAVRTGVGAGQEALLEVGQDYVNFAVQDIASALSMDVPDVVWMDGENGVLDGFWKDYATNFVTMLPLAIFGAAGGVSADRRVKAFKDATDTQLMALGARPEDVAEFRASGGIDTGNAAIDKMFANLDPQSETAKASTEAMLSEQEAAGEAASLAQDSGVFPTITQSADGWTVTDRTTGTQYGPVSSVDQAVKLAEANFSAVQNATANQMDYLTSMLESVESSKALDRPGSQTDTVVDLGLRMTPAIMQAASPQAAEDLRLQIEAMEKAGELTPGLARIVYGMSQTDANRMQRQTVNKLFQGASVATVFHEYFHGIRREALAQNRITPEEELEFLMAMDAEFKGSKNKRNLALGLLPEGVTREQVTEKMRDEAISKLAEAEVLKSRRGGRNRDTEKRDSVLNLPAGTVTRNIRSLVRGGMKSAKKFSDLFNAVRGYFGLAMGRAVILRQLERKGSPSAGRYQEYLSKLTGLTEQDMVDRKASEVAQEITGDPSFSVGDEIIDPLISNAASRIKDPKMRAKAFGGIVTRLQKLKEFADNRGVAFNFDAFGKAFEGEFTDEKTQILNALAVLDGILAVVPPDLRGRVGGYTQLAKQETNAQRLSYLKRRLDRVDKVITDYLRKEYTGMLDAIVEKSEAKKKGGKKPVGKLGAEGHEFFDNVKAVLDMTEEEVGAQSLRIDVEVGNTDPADIEALSDLAEQFQIVNTFGNFSGKDLSAMAEAVELANRVYDTNRNLWKTQEEIRLGTLQRNVQTAIKDIGGNSTAAVQRAKAKSMKLLSAVEGGQWSIKSFHEVLEGVFGEESTITKRWAKLNRDGLNKKTTEILKAQKRWKEVTESSTGKKGRAARRQVWDMATKQSVKAVIAPERTETIKVPIDTFFDAANRSSLGLTDVEITQLEEQFEALDPKSRKKYLTLERSVPSESESASFTEAEAIYLTMLWRQQGYQEGLRKNGMGEQFQADLEASMSDAAKDIRAFLANEYRDNYEPLRALYAKMFGVNLPNTENYTPGRFYSQGDDAGMDVTGSGFVDGGIKQGFLKSRKRHSAEAKAENAFAIFFNHLNQTEHWKAMAEVSREMHGILGNTQVKKALAAKDPELSPVLSQWLEAIDGNGLNKNKSSWLLDAITTSQAYLAMSWKASTIIKNAVGATVNAAYKMSLRDYAVGMSRMMSGKIDFKEIWDSDLIQNRLAGGFSPEAREAIGRAFGAEPTLRGDFLMKGMEVIGTADAFGTTIGAAIAYDYHYRDAIRSGSTPQDAKVIAMDQVSEIISRTAQPVNVTDRSLMELRLNGIGKIAFVFASEARQKSSMWLTAWAKTLTGKPTKKDMRVLFMSHMVVAPLMHAVGVMIRDARDPDDDEWFDEKYWNPLDFLKAMATGPLAGIPLIRDVFDGFSGDSGPLKRIADSGLSLKRLFLDEPRGDEQDWYVNQIIKTLQGTTPSVAVGASVFDQIYDFIRNWTDD